MRELALVDVDGNLIRAGQELPAIGTDDKNGGGHMAKHFINARETIVTEALDGLIAARAGGWRGSTAIPRSRSCCGRTAIRARWRWSRAAAPGTSRRMRASSGAGC